MTAWDIALGVAGGLGLLLVGLVAAVWALHIVYGLVRDLRQLWRWARSRSVCGVGLVLGPGMCVRRAHHLGAHATGPYKRGDGTYFRMRFRNGRIWHEDVKDT